MGARWRPFAFSKDAVAIAIAVTSSTRMLRTRFRRDSLEKVRSVSEGSLDCLTCDHDDIARLFACESRNSRSAVHPETAHVEHAGVTRAPAHPLHPRRVLLAPFRATRFARHTRLTRVALVTLQKISISWSMVIVARTTFCSVGRGRLIRCGDPARMCAGGRGRSFYRDLNFRRGGLFCQMPVLFELI